MQPKPTDRKGCPTILPDDVSVVASQAMKPDTDDGNVRLNPGKVAAIVAMAMTVSGVIWGAASTNERITNNAISSKERMDAFEARQKTLEDKIEWQNKQIWEMRTDLRVLVIRSGGTPAKSDP